MKTSFITVLLLTLAACPVITPPAARAAVVGKKTDVSTHPDVKAAQTKRNEAERALQAAKAKTPASKEENKAAVAEAQKARDEAQAELEKAREKAARGGKK